MAEPHVLDDPPRFALDGPQAFMAQRAGRAARFPADVGPFGAVPADATAEEWRELAALTPAAVVVVGRRQQPEGWNLQLAVEGRQMILPDEVQLPDAEVDPLGPDDVDAMLALIERTRPGPFERRTIELGRYIGIHEDGELIAMAGERMKPPGWTEISAVCVAPEHRGRGLARRVVGAVVAGIRGRGDRAMLHVAGDNVGAIALYESLGFVTRRTLVLSVLAPA